MPDRPNEERREKEEKFPNMNLAKGYVNKCPCEAANHNTRRIMSDCIGVVNCKLHSLSSGAIKSELDCRGGRIIGGGSFECFVDSEFGSLMATVSEEIETHVFEHVCVFAGFWTIWDIIATVREHPQSSALVEKQTWTRLVLLKS